MSCDAAFLLCVADPRHRWLWIGQVESCVVFVVVVGSGLFSVSLKLIETCMVFRSGFPHKLDQSSFELNTMTR
jgi:hypothetical protein